MKEVVQLKSSIKRLNQQDGFYSRPSSQTSQRTISTYSASRPGQASLACPDLAEQSGALSQDRTPFFIASSASKL
jgi:hypothetical protein